MNKDKLREEIAEDEKAVVVGSAEELKGITVEEKKRPCANTTSRNITNSPFLGLVPEFKAQRSTRMLPRC